MCGELKWAGRVVLTVVAVVLAVAGGACAKVIYVDDDAPPGGDGSSWATAYTFLQDALAEAEATEETVEIRLAQGTYRPDRSYAHPEGTGDRYASFRLADDVVLKGGYAGLGPRAPNVRDISACRTILSGDLSGNDIELANPLDASGESSRADNCHHVVVREIYDEEPAIPSVELDGLTITGGHAFRHKTSGSVPAFVPQEHLGGGLLFVGRRTQVTVRDCLFEGNYAEEIAGAVYCAAKDLILVGCTLCNNGTNKWGGGLYVGESAVQLNNCLLEGNHAGYQGGGILCGGNYEVRLSHCVLGKNTARMGGAMVGHGNGNLVCSHCAFRENHAVTGGAVFLHDGPFDAVHCRFVGNQSEGVGGAVTSFANEPVKLMNCFFCGNRAAEGGGAWRSQNANEQIFVDSTAVGNRAPKGQFLLDASQSPGAGSTEVRNCIISNGDNEICNDKGTITIRYTDLVGGAAAIDDPSGLVVWGDGNIDADPCFVNPGYWDANGTPDDPNDDFFVAGDYHLKSQAGRWDPVSASWVQDDVSSPCIDAGDPNRPVGYEPFPNGGVINMGAYGGMTEASKSYFNGPVCETVIAGDVNGDCRVDFKDLVILLNHWLESGERAEE